MTAYNVVRYRAKRGRDKELEELIRTGVNAAEAANFGGLRKVALIKIGERNYCFIGEWDSFDALANARSAMIKNLDRNRDLLEDLGGGLGVTYAVSGEAIFELDISAIRAAKA